MTQEDKQLLLKDLCARLPYGAKIYYKTAGWEDKNHTLSPQTIDNFLFRRDVVIKPYLRPLSSMTEDESAELSNIISEWFDKELFYLTEEPFLEYALSIINYSISPLLFDWLNKHHFDYRGLIKKGLAISTEEFNLYNEDYDSRQF